MVVIDLGGQWLGAQHTPLRQLAENLGCETFPTHDDGDQRCAMNLPPGVWTSSSEALHAPVGRLHRAGSDVATQSAGRLDGAVRGGRAASAALLALRS